MRMGVKTLLYGGHQFVLHPLFVVAAWARLYGIPGFRELICIGIHDWGLWSCDTIDFGVGELHPEGGARIAGRLFGWRYHDLVAYHSRFYARVRGHGVSKLCLADKLGTALYPTWLWVFLVRLTGEYKEYLANRKYEIWKQDCSSLRTWFEDYKRICSVWVATGDLAIQKGNMV